jgi:hypothetical protein
LSQDTDILNSLFKEHHAFIKGTQNLPTLRTPPLPNLLPCHPLRTPLSKVFALGDKTLMDRAGEQGDAVPINLIAKVLTGDTDL